MKKLAFVALAMFAIVFALGCGGKTEAGTPGSSSGAGYTLTVMPTEIIEGGTATIDLRLENIFQENMDNVKVKFKDVGSIYTGTQGTTTVGTIMPGQTYPVILSLDGNDEGTLSGKNIQVCFDYDTEYYFDVGLKSNDKATEQLSVESGASSGPMSVSVTGLENVFFNNQKGTGALTLSNTWIGKILKITTISADFPIGTYITNGTLGISTCSDSALSSTDKKATLSSTDITNCKILTNDVAIGNGLTLKAEVGTSIQTSTTMVERVLGNVVYNYCYDIPLPTITIKSVS